MVGETPTAPQRTSPRTRFLWMGLRLSVVVAVVSGLVDAYGHYNTALEDQRSNFRRRLSYECAAKARDEDLLKARNDFDNINVRGAPFFCADRDFYVAIYELEMVRKGTMDFSSARPWFYWHSTVAAMVGGFIATNMVALFLVGMAVVVRWVLGPLPSGR